MFFIAGTVDSPANRSIQILAPLKLVSVNFEQSLRPISGYSSTVEVGDSILSRNTAASVTDYNVSYSTLGGLSGDLITSNSSNSGIGTFETPTLLRHVSNGNIIVTTVHHEQSIQNNVTMSTVTGASQSADILVGFTTGSLSENVTIELDSRINDKNPIVAKPIFSTMSHPSGSYVRNEECWAYDLDLTPISPWNSVSSNTLGITAIARDIVIGAAHAFPFLGSTVRFVTYSNTVITRTVTKTKTHPNYSPYSPDIAIGLLNEPLPESIGIVKMLPSSYTGKLPTLSSKKSLPCLCLDQENKALVTDFAQISNNRALFSSIFSLNSEQRTLFYESKVGGDSGKPAFLVLNGELILITVWTYGGAGSGPFLTNYISDINAMISQLGSSSTVTTVDLSSYTNF